MPKENLVFLLLIGFFSYFVSTTAYLHMFFAVVIFFTNTFPNVVCQCLLNGRIKKGGEKNHHALFWDLDYWLNLVCKYILLASFAIVMQRKVPVQSNPNRYNSHPLGCVWENRCMYTTLSIFCSKVRYKIFGLVPVLPFFEVFARMH